MFNLNTWPNEHRMEITPRHGREFCEVTYNNRKLYTGQKDEFIEDTKAEYKQLPNALLMLRLVSKILLYVLDSYLFCVVLMLDRLQ